MTNNNINWLRKGGDGLPELFSLKVFGEEVRAYRDILGDFWVLAEDIAQHVVGTTHAKSMLRNVAKSNYSTFGNIIKKDLLDLEKWPEAFSERPRLVFDNKGNQITFDLKQFLFKDGTVKKHLKLGQTTGIDSRKVLINEVGLYEAILAGSTERCSLIRTDLAQLLKKMRKKAFLEDTTNILLDLTEIEMYKYVETNEAPLELRGGVTHKGLEALESALDKEGLTHEVIRRNTKPKPQK